MSEGLKRARDDVLHRVTSGDAAERGKLDLEAAVKSYVPELGSIQVIEGFSDAGEPKLRAQARPHHARAADETAAHRHSAMHRTRPAHAPGSRSNPNLRE